MLVIPLSATPSQSVNVLLNGQNCQITLTTRHTGLFLDLYINNVPIALGNLCEDRNPMVTKAYLGFVGRLAFSDMQGTTDPDYTGLGVRYLLSYSSTGNT